MARVVLCSSDPFGLPVLERLAAAGVLAGLVTQPDRPHGRGRKPEPLPIKQRAQALGVPVLQPEKIGDPEARSALAALAPDFLVIAAYAQYLPKAVRSIPRNACLNIHPSLLPKYRGSSPVAAALWEGDSETGVAIHFTEAGIDTGDLLGVRHVAIEPDDNRATLSGRLSESGAELLLEVIAQFDAGTTTRTPQDHTRATLTRKLTPADRELDFHLPAQTLVNRIRALAPEPCALLPWGDEEILMHAATIAQADRSDAQPGTTRALPKSRLAIACAEEWLEPLVVQPPGRRAMPAGAWLNGQRDPWPARIPSRPGNPEPLVRPIAEVPA